MLVNSHRSCTIYKLKNHSLQIIQSTVNDPNISKLLHKIVQTKMASTSSHLLSHIPTKVDEDTKILRKQYQLLPNQT